MATEVSVHGVTKTKNFLKSPLRVSTPKLMIVCRKCIIDKKNLGVLIETNGGEFECTLMEKVKHCTKISKE